VLVEGEMVGGGCGAGVAGSCGMSGKGGWSRGRTWGVGLKGGDSGRFPIVRNAERSHENVCSLRVWSAAERWVVEKFVTGKGQ